MTFLNKLIIPILIVIIIFLVLDKQKQQNSNKKQQITHIQKSKPAPKNKIAKIQELKIQELKIQELKIQELKIKCSTNKKIIDTPVACLKTDIEAKFNYEAATISHLFETIDKIYVDKIDKQKALENSIKGLLNGLDPHSDFLKPKEQKELNENSNGEFGGIGIVVSKKDNFIEIISPIDNTPGYRAGLKAGDVIVKINGKVVRGMSLEDGVDLMRGKPKTKITLTISRKGKALFNVEIIRDIITIISAKGYLLDKNLGYIRISSFQAPTKDLVIKALKELKTKNKGDLKSIILDLRNNPGGLLSSAVNISDIFLNKEKLVVYTKGRTKSSNTKLFSKNKDITNNAKVVVLINKGSASASEIVAGALQDHKRAIIIGEKSFGKGSVQTVLSLTNGYGLKLTTARYYTPNGRSIQAKGIVPDVLLTKYKLQEKEVNEDITISESSLNNHIKASNDKQQNSSTATIVINNNSKEKDVIKSLKKDYFVHEAINILKVLNITN